MSLCGEPRGLVVDSGVVQPKARTGGSGRSSLWQQGSPDGGFALTRASLAHDRAPGFRRLVRFSHEHRVLIQPLGPSR